MWTLRESLKNIAHAGYSVAEPGHDRGNWKHMDKVYSRSHPIGAQLAGKCLCNSNNSLLMTSAGLPMLSSEAFQATVCIQILLSLVAADM